jgi:NhaA family Na+:H+ antiporter
MQNEKPKEHVIADDGANGEIVHYGDYDCVDCGKLQEILADVLDDQNVPVRYVFRHFPRGFVDEKSVAERSLVRAIAAEAAARQGRFWEMHAALFEHVADQDQGIEKAVEQAGLDKHRFELDRDDPLLREQVIADIEKAKDQGVERVPTLRIRGKEYRGAWDAQSIAEAVIPPVGHRVKEIATEFADWAPASGTVLIVFAVLALIWRNSFLGESYESFWTAEAGFVAAGQTLVMSLHHWVNDLFMAVFFLIVGLELKRELLSGQLAELRQAIFPAAAALGGMILPAAIYLAFNVGAKSQSGWGVPMATDIAFTLGVLALLGSRVPTSLKIFATALAIIDDLGAILVLALAYNHGISWTAIGAAAILFGVLVGLNRARVYAMWPYLFVGILLWVAVYASGLHATLAGVLLATTIPTREKAPLRPLLAQELARAKQAERRLVRDDVQEEDERDRLLGRVKTLEGRLNPPAEKLEHILQPWSAYFVIPVFTLANAGIAISFESISLTSASTLGIVLGLVVGKPLGILLATWIVHKLGIGEKPDDASWRQILGVGCLCGIGFTMSIFISTEAFDAGQNLNSAKFAVMLGSIAAALLGTAWLTFACEKESSAT